MLDSEKRFWTIPNVLSLFRIALIPLFVWCFFASFAHNRNWSMVIFLAAGGTDVIDVSHTQKIQANQRTALNY